MLLIPAAFRQPVTDPVFKPLDSFRIKAVAGSRTFDLAVDQSSLTQDFKVLANGGLSQRQGLHNVIGDADLPGSQVLHNLKADRVAEGFQHAGQALLFSIQRAIHIVILRYNASLSRVLKILVSAVKMNHLGFGVEQVASLQTIYNDLVQVGRNLAATCQPVLKRTNSAIITNAFFDQKIA